MVLPHAGGRHLQLPSASVLQHLPAALVHYLTSPYLLVAAGIIVVSRGPAAAEDLLCWISSNQLRAATATMTAAHFLITGTCLYASSKNKAEMVWA